MTDNVFTFPGVDKPTLMGEPNETVIHILKMLLADAESGKLQGVAIAAYDNTDSTMVSWSSGDTTRLVAAIARLQLDYMLNDRTIRNEEN